MLRAQSAVTMYVWYFYDLLDQLQIWKIYLSRLNAITSQQISLGNTNLPVCLLRKDWSNLFPNKPERISWLSDIYLFSNLSRHCGENDDISPQLYVVTSFDVIALASDGYKVTLTNSNWCGYMFWHLALDTEYLFTYYSNEYCDMAYSVGNCDVCGISWHSKCLWLLMANSVILSEDIAFGYWER